jgi:GTP 3',8-cyclase
VLNNIDYLRISITNRCNLKCLYCHPLSDAGLKGCKEILELDEILHIVRLFTRYGVKKVRLTGGEPLLREDILQLVKELSAIEGVEDLSITTNGIHLESLANELKTAGLQRINISVDSTDRAKFKKITGFDLLREATGGIYKAIEAGLNPVKINSVIVKGINSDKKELLSLAQMSVDLPVAVRFVEYNPTSRFSELTRGFVSNIEVKKIIEEEFGHIDKVTSIKGYGPAVYFKIKNSPGAIGFISGRSSIFCNQCNRLRLSCDGKIKPCLYSAKQYDLKNLLKNDAEDEEILQLIRTIIQEKSRYNKKNMPLKEFSMQSIGG